KHEAIAYGWGMAGLGAAFGEWSRLAIAWRATRHNRHGPTVLSGPAGWPRSPARSVRGRSTRRRAPRLRELPTGVLHAAQKRLETVGIIGVDQRIEIDLLGQLEVDVRLLEGLAKPEHEGTLAVVQVVSELLERQREIVSRHLAKRSVSHCLLG